MFINFRSLEAASECIPVLDMETILNRKATATYDFLKMSRLKIIRKGRESHILKKDLLHYLDKQNWLPSGFLAEL